MRYTSNNSSAPGGGPAGVDPRLMQMLGDYMTKPAAASGSTLDPGNELNAGQGDWIMSALNGVGSAAGAVGGLAGDLVDLF